jgi:hypothetical protein
MQLEREHISLEPRFDPLTRAYRTAQLLEAHSQLPLALKYYELALRAEWAGPPLMPDPDESDVTLCPPAPAPPPSHPGPPSPAPSPNPS